MDRFPEICRLVAMLRQAFDMPGAPKETPTLEYSEWLLAEVERLRKIEDAVELWTKGTSEGARKLIEAWNDNPRPGKEG